MSSGEADPRAEALAELERLELLVGRAVAGLRAWRGRAIAAEKRLSTMEATLREVTSGRMDPHTLNAELEGVRAENRELRRRLDESRGRIAKIMERIEMLSETK